MKTLAQALTDALQRKDRIAVEQLTSTVGDINAKLANQAQMILVTQLDIDLALAFDFCLENFPEHIRDVFINKTMPAASLSKGLKLAAEKNNIELMQMISEISDKLDAATAATIHTTAQGQTILNHLVANDKFSSLVQSIAEKNSFALFFPLSFENDRRQLLECLQLNPSLFSDAKHVLTGQRTPRLNSNTWGYLKKLLQNTQVKITVAEIRALDQLFSPETSNVSAGTYSCSSGFPMPRKLSTESTNSNSLTTLIEKMSILDRAKNRSVSLSAASLENIFDKLQSRPRVTTHSTIRTIPMAMYLIDGIFELMYSDTYTVSEVLRKIIHENQPTLLAEVIKIANDIEVQLNQHGISEFSVAPLFIDAIDDGAYGCLIYLLENHFSELEKSIPGLKEILFSKLFWRMATLDQSDYFEKHINILLKNAPDNLKKQCVDILKTVIADPSVSADRSSRLTQTLFDHKILKKEDIVQIINVSLLTFEDRSIDDSKFQEVNEALSKANAEMINKFWNLSQFLWDKFGLTTYDFSFPKYHSGSGERNFFGMAHIYHPTVIKLREDFYHHIKVCVIYKNKHFDDPTLVQLFTPYLDDSQLIILSRSLYQDIQAACNLLASDNNTIKMTPEQSDRINIAGHLNTILRNLTIKIFSSKDAQAETTNQFKQIVTYEATMKTPSVMNQFFFMLMRRMLTEVDGQKKLVMNIHVWNALKEGYLAAIKASGKEINQDLVANLIAFKHPSEARQASDSNVSVATSSKEKPTPSTATNSNMSAPAPAPLIYPPAGNPPASAASTSLGLFTPIQQAVPASAFPPAPVHSPEIPQSERPDEEQKVKLPAQ